ncbi:hypothetical protein [Trinickia dabaoshanensis]|uniref:hypothetical protein n=1 Tax=Trinickia dabaoshanensis TaxID=564714 RepID=UPI0011AF9E20|nr:hypothetical protein [Trinickia dabaoshanensis]
MAYIVGFSRAVLAAIIEEMRRIVAPYKSQSDERRLGTVAATGNFFNLPGISDLRGSPSALAEHLRARSR